MGERNRKARFDAEGIPRPRDAFCPGCGSKQIMDMPRERFEAVVRPDANWQGCLACKAVWEAFPTSYARDPVCAEPCDNCAFRPGSPEQRDPKAWRELIATLRNGDGMTRGGIFFCHKGVPIDLSKGPGNFLFPTKPVMMDGKALRNADGTEVTTMDTAKMRTCSGYLRMIWALRAKAGDEIDYDRLAAVSPQRSDP